MHKILIQTELVRLRQLGYEVFCPKYHSKSSLHQSAANGWTADQKTTLSPEVFKILSEFNFFYHQIPPKIMQLLNQNFDVVIVTIDPSWLVEVLRGFKGKLIYRTYGHIQSMSDFFEKHSARNAIQCRNNFWYMPFSLEYAQHEAPWLRERMLVAPYCVTDEVQSFKDTWQGGKKEIMISCPNISNPYYLSHYKYLKSHFADPHFKFYGVQTTQTKDPQFVGTITFHQLLDAYKDACGFLYTYREQSVCFLPPIEMMIVGGPVIYLADSLLDQFFASTWSPGRARNETEAKEKCKRLLDGDKDFANEVIQSQKSVRSRYLPKDVWPLFDKAINSIISSTNSSTTVPNGEKIAPILYQAESPKLLYALMNPKWSILKIKYIAKKLLKL